MGTWKVVGLTADGREIDIRLAGMRFEFSADGTYRQTNANEPAGMAGPFVLDPKADPPMIDLEESREGKSVIRQGIYRVADDTLTLAFALKRPAKFDSPAGESITLWRCKRVKTTD